MPEKTFADKVSEILASPRFIQLALIAAISSLKVALPDNVWITAIWTFVTTLFGSSVIVGTVDRVKEKSVEIAKIEAVTEAAKSEAVVEAAKITADASVVK